MKIVATRSTAPRAVIANAQALRRLKTKTTASTRATIASAAGRIGGKTSLSLRSTATFTVHARKPTCHDCGRDRECPRRRLGPLAEVAGRAEREKGRAVEGEEQHHGNPGQERVHVEQVPERAGEVAARVDRHAVEQVRKRDSPDQRRAEAADRVAPEPDRPPARALALRAPLEREHADDQEEEEQQQGDVEAREHRRVPGREGRERRAARDHEPDLVAVPDRADRAEHVAALALVPRQERQQHADAEVEALEQEVPAPEDADQHEPEVLQVHQYATAGGDSGAPSSGSASEGSTFA